MDSNTGKVRRITVERVPCGRALRVCGTDRVIAEIIRPGWSVGVEWCASALYFSFAKLALVFNFSRG